MFQIALAENMLTLCTLRGCLSGLNNAFIETCTAKKSFFLILVYFAAADRPLKWKCRNTSNFSTFQQIMWVVILWQASGTSLQKQIDV